MKRRIVIFTIVLSLHFIIWASPSQAHDYRKNCNLVVTLLGKGAAGKGTQAAAILREYKMVGLSLGVIFRERVKEWDRAGRPGIPEFPLSADGFSTKRIDREEVAAILRAAEAFIKGSRFSSLSPEARTHALDALTWLYMDRLGANVPEEVANPALRAFILGVPQDCGILLDGCPRRFEQVTLLDKLLSGAGRKIDLAILLEISDETSRIRKDGRLLCVNCGYPYHPTYRAPKVRGVCDHCGSALRHRGDDTREGADRLLRTYQSDVLPIIAGFGRRGILKTLSGEGDANEITEQIREVVDRELK